MSVNPDDCVPSYRCGPKRLSWSWGAGLMPPAELGGSEAGLETTWRAASRVGVILGARLDALLKLVQPLRHGEARMMPG